MLIHRLRWLIASIITSWALAVARWISPPEAIARRLAGRDEPDPTDDSVDADNVVSEEPTTMMLGPQLVDAIDRELQERGL